MAKEQKSFIKGRMNKSVDERLLPEGEYIDALNIRLGSTELSEVGAVENSKGNVQLTELKYNGVALSGDAVCIGAFDDSAEETMYWFVHDPNHSYGGVVDMIVSFNTQTQLLTYHVVTTALLNFNPTYLVNAVDKIDDLLFFTDDYNPPRKINVTRGYAQPVANVDQIIELDISVIKPQPMNSPVLTLQANLANDNFMEDTFLCFAYRYKYKDGEYSAISQFSDPAFTPSDFFLERRSFMNGGMENAINSVVVEFNTGSENVVGIDVVFKEMDSNTIWVAKKLKKADYGYQNNSTESITFSNGDIYTVLSEGEILRLYDNVPRLAKAQTIMGNRVMYGNYLEGYDLKDDLGTDIQLTYTVDQESETVNSFVKNEDRDCVGCLYDYTYNFYYGADTPSLSFPYSSYVIDLPNEILVDLNGIPTDELLDGAEISIAVDFANGLVFSPSTGMMPQFYYPYYNNPAEYVAPSSRPVQTVMFSYTIQGNHSDLDSAFGGTPWFDQVGTSGNYQESPDDWNSGFTFTDAYNSATNEIIPQPLDPTTFPTLKPVRSARDTANGTFPFTGTDPVGLYVDGGFLHIIPNGIQYTKTTSNVPNDHLYDNVYMIPELRAVRVTFRKSGTQKSLHSNRDYQVGIVYQDKEGRQSTVLESKENSFHISAYDSESINWAKVTIPKNMKPPYWADRYKFVMKQTETDYETIYSTTYFREVLGIDGEISPRTGRVWVRLEGENADKVKEGQELYVKVDYSGALDIPVKTTVLEVKSMANGDIYEELNGNPAPTPAGVYMLIVPNNFSISFTTDTSVLTYGKLTEKTTNGSGLDRGYPDTLMYPLHDDGGGVWEIPEGTTVRIKTHLHRREYDKIEQDKCGRETCNFEYEGVASQDYNNLRDFFLGEGVNIPAKSDCGPWGYDDDSGANVNIFYENVYDYDNPNTFVHYTAPTALDPNTYNAVRGRGPNSVDENHFQFAERPSTNEFWFEIQSGTHHCWGGGSLARSSKIECEIAIYPADAALVFETIPTTTNGEVYYENGESFEIVNGNHLSGSKNGDVDQVVGSTDGVVNLGFFNCYTFFNGVESYKIRDSITGKKIYLGNRVTAVSEQDYMEIRRGASVTYSGIYNAQNNVNKLNEFNLGLANYKDCEESYGPIQVLHGRRTDILTLQEDRISYIAVGKNLLTDAVGGGIITSVPEVLGVQVARNEEYGISENPESFCHYGKDVYFTDAKRSSVLQLKGGEGIDSLNVVSNIGMRSWFRDLFQTSFNRQKLGGYDPYMDEYVLSPNTNRLPFEVPVIECGGGDIQLTGLLEPQTFIVEFGNTFGNVTVSGNASVSTTIDVTYNGTTTSSGAVTGNFSVVFDKDVPSITQATVTITPNDPATDSVTIVDSIACPVADFVKIRPILITSQSDAYKTRTQEFYFEDTLSGYVSPTWQDANVMFQLQNQGYTSVSIVSKFGGLIYGSQGTGMIPIDLATVTLGSKRLKGQDTYFFDLSSDKMSYWRTSIGYQNNAADIATILANVIPVTNSGAEPDVSGTFLMPSGGNDDFLYLVWDYRDVNEVVLCYMPTIEEACCDCVSSPSCIPFEGSYIQTSSVNACAQPSNSTIWYTSAVVVNGVRNTLPVQGARIFGGNGCDYTSGRRYPAGFIHYDDNGTSKWIEIDSDNIVINTGTC